MKVIDEEGRGRCVIWKHKSSITSLSSCHHDIDSSKVHINISRTSLAVVDVTNPNRPIGAMKTGLLRNVGEKIE